MGVFQANIGIWQILARQGEIKSAQLNESWQKVVTEGGSGYSLSLSPRTFAGQPSECISWKYQGSGIEYCVSAGGVLSYVRVSGTSTRSTYSVVLKSYSTKVSASDFSLPK